MKNNGPIALLLILGILTAYSSWADNDYCVACSTGQSKCHSDIGGEAGLIECGVRNNSCSVSYYDGRTCKDPRAGKPLAGDIPPRILTALSQGTPVLAMLFYPDDAASNGVYQCTGPGAGRSYALANEWIPFIRIDTDDRPGGCQQSWAIIDPKNTLKNIAISLNFYPDGDPGQCTPGGMRSIPVNSIIPKTEAEIVFSDPIRIDADQRSGGCDEDFSASGKDAAASLDIKFYPDGDPGQCGNSTGNDRFASVRVGAGTIHFRIDTDNRSGGCRQEFRLTLPENDSDKAPQIKAGA